MFLPFNVTEFNNDGEAVGAYELVLNTDHICSFYANDEGNAVISMSDGITYEVLLPAMKFWHAIEDEGERERIRKMFIPTN